MSDPMKIVSGVFGKELPGLPVSREDFWAGLGDVKSSRRRMREIVEAASNESGFSTSEILSKSRGEDDLARTRQVCMYCARIEGIRPTRIANFFKRDVATVRHAESSVRKRLRAAEIAELGGANG